VFTVTVRESPIAALTSALSVKRSGRRIPLRLTGLDRPALCLPDVEAAIQHRRPIEAERAQHPPDAGRPHHRPDAVQHHLALVAQPVPTEGAIGRAVVAAQISPPEPSREGVGRDQGVGIAQPDYPP
jgi:hypothetical protein